jgi:hypothetical protein
LPLLIFLQDRSVLRTLADGMSALQPWPTNYALELLSSCFKVTYRRLLSISALVACLLVLAGLHSEPQCFL